MVSFLFIVGTVSEIFVCLFLRASFCFAFAAYDRKSLGKTDTPICHYGHVANSGFS